MPSARRKVLADCPEADSGDNRVLSVIRDPEVGGNAEPLHVLAGPLVGECRHSTS